MEHTHIREKESRTGEGGGEGMGKREKKGQGKREGREGKDTKWNHLIQS